MCRATDYQHCGKENGYGTLLQKGQKGGYRKEKSIIINHAKC